MASNKKSRFSPFLKQCFVTAGVGCNIIGHGCVLGFPAILRPQLALKDLALTIEKHESAWLASITVIIIPQLVGCLMTLLIMDRYGRKMAHFAVITPNLISWFMLTLTYNFETLFAARVLQELSIGMLSPLRSVLIAEYTSPKNRGAFLTTVSLTQTFGIFLVHLIGKLLSWRTTALICAIFPVISLVITFCSPESPSWLVAKGRNEDCRKIFHWLRGDEEDDELEAMIHSRLEYERAKISEKYERHTNKFQDMLITIKKPEFYKPIILMMHAYVLVIFCGDITMLLYSTIFTDSITDALKLVFNTSAVFAIYKFKRRTVMFVSGAISVIAQFADAGYLYFNKQGSLHYEVFWIPSMLIIIKILVIAVGIIPVPNVIGGEVFPLEYRSIGGMISFVSFSGTFLLVLKTFEALVDSIGMYGVYFVYGCILTYCLIVIWILLPETKDKTLQQIEDEFRGKPLVAEEIEAQQSLHEDDIVAHERKMSTTSACSIHI